MSRSVIAVTLAGCALVGIGVIHSRPAGTAAAGQSEPASFVIDNVRLFDGERMLEARRVLIRDGAIAAVGVELPRGVEVVDGKGGTLLPGFIDAHTHAFGDALERALLFGVTTELDMFTDHRFAAGMRDEQRQPGGARGRADLFSSGTLVTAPGGHGTEYGLEIPTLTSPADAEAFVDARLAEGSDYIKIVYDSGATYGLGFRSIDRETLRAAIRAARNRNRLAVVHIGARQSAEEAIEAGASGLVHIFGDAAPRGDFAASVARAAAFVTPTLSVIESTTGVPSGASLATHPELEPFITPAERTALNGSFPKRAGSRVALAHALDATRQLHAAGVPILAGTDAPNPGTAHGLSMHRELELLVRAGLTPAAALAAATSIPARIFGLDDRGRIAVGRRADLLLVGGDPIADITATRRIVGVWKGGRRVERRTAAATTSMAEAKTTTGLVSDFEQDEPRAEFGAGWQVSTDRRMGGKSDAGMRVIPGGANGSRGALEISGTIVAGAPFPWGGAMFFPADTPMTPVNLSRFKEIVFQARGDGADYQLMLFAERLGNIPAVHTFTASGEWQELAVPFSALSGLDGSDIRGLLFSAAAPGPFRLAIDNVRFR